MRCLSLVHALLDESPAITCAHLEAALAVWDYAEAPVRLIFGELTGDPVAGRIMAALRGGATLEKRDLFDLFGRNVSAARLDRAIELLIATGRVRLSRREGEGPGRPATLLSASPIATRTAS